MSQPQSSQTLDQYNSDEHIINAINWVRLPVKDPFGDSFFVKFKSQGDGFLIYLTNMKSVWKKQCEKEDIEMDSNNYCKGLNMSVDSHSTN